MFSLFMKGLIIGLAIAAPVGPIGILCIQRSLHGGFRIGLMTGLGAALADGTYGLIAGFGLASISSLLIEYQFWIRIIGGLFLFYLGIKIMLTSVAANTQNAEVKQSAWKACGTTFFLTLSNPATILSFIAVFAGLGLGTINPDYEHALALVIGITLGSALWWLVLSSVVAFVLHHRLGQSSRKWINRLSGIVMIAFGAVALWI